MPSFLYVLRSSSTGSYVIGSTNNLEEKLEQQNSRNGYGRQSAGPWECVYVEICDTLETARQRERFLKSEDGVEEKIRILYTPTGSAGEPSRRSTS